MEKHRSLTNKQVPNNIKNEEEFLQLLYIAIIYHRSEIHAGCSGADVAEETDFIIFELIHRVAGFARQNKFENLLNSWKNSPTDANSWPSYTDVVFGLYELLTRPYINDEIQGKIWIILEQCSNHNFQRFVRLTNPRHNPNKRSRDRAMSILYQISTGFNSALGGCRGVQWQKGAKRIVDKLLKTGRYILDAHRD